MKPTVYMVLLALCLLLSGCASWLDGSYSSVTPHATQQAQVDQGLVTVSTIQDSIAFLTDMTENGREYAVFALDPANAEKLLEEMDTAIRYVMGNTPIAAFTVDNISYDVGSTAGAQAVGITVSYNTNQIAMKKMRKAESSEIARDMITEALTQCKERVLIQIEEYSYVDFEKHIREFIAARPDAVMETPQVTIHSYPESGDVRVLDVRFSYQNQLETLRTMQNYVQPLFAAAELSVRGEDTEYAKFTRLYAFLMERNDYRQGVSNTPAYSLLRHGVGDSMAFARVYAAMCQKAELECYVVSGTRNGEPWSWNIFREGDRYYHIDLLRADAQGGFHRWSDREMEGYVWDYSSYPACEGT